MHNLKVEDYVLFRKLAEDLSLEDSLSDSTERLLWRGEGGARICRSFCNKDHQKITIHSFDMHLNYLGSVSCFSQGAHLGGGAAVADVLMAATSFVYWYGRYFLSTPIKGPIAVALRAFHAEAQLTFTTILSKVIEFLLQIRKLMLNGLKQRAPVLTVGEKQQPTHAVIPTWPITCFHPKAVNNWTHQEWDFAFRLSINCIADPARESQRKVW